MDRREFSNRTTKAPFGLRFSTGLAAKPRSDSRDQRQLADPPFKQTLSTLPGTVPLTLEADMAQQMVDGIYRPLLRRTKEASDERPRLWS